MDYTLEEVAGHGYRMVMGDLTLACIYPNHKGKWEVDRECLDCGQTHDHFRTPEDAARAVAASHSTRMLLDDYEAEKELNDE